MKLRLIILLSVLLLGACLWWLWPRDEVVAQQALPRPSEVNAQRETQLTLRPKEVPVVSTRVEEPVVEVSHLVKVAIGADEATARRYVARSEAVWKLGKDLPDEAVEALLEYLRSTEDVLREERVDALKNDIMNVLRAQKRVSPQLSETLIAMFDSQAYGVAMLDYCIQHLGAVQEASADEEERSRIYACLQRATRVPGASYAGTALIALLHTPHEDDDMRHFVNERVAALLYAEDSHEAAKVTATQIAAERGYAELLPVIRRMATDESLPLTQRVVSIGALGRFGCPEDIELLEKRVVPDANPRLLPAVEAALKQLKQATKESR